MILLLFNIVFSSLFTLCIKWVQLRKREDIVTVGMVNYLAAFLASLPEYLLADNVSTTAYSLATGALMGVGYFVAFFVVVYAIKWIGAANATVIGVLSILVPILCGIYIWDENPNRFQILGVVLALVSLSLIGGKKDQVTDSDQQRPWFTPLILILFFFLCGSTRLAQEAFKHLCQADERPAFLICAFGLAAGLSLVVLAIRGRRISRSEWLIGIGLGLANILQSHFLLKALNLYDGFIVFPLTSAGGLMFTTLVATWFLSERLSWQSYAGITIAVAALVLLNL